MSLKEMHQEYIIEKLHKTYLYDGVIPTSDMLKEDFDIYKESIPDLSKPVSKYIDFNVDRGSNASASLIETIKSAVDDDVSILTRETYRIADKSKRLYDRCVAEINRLEAKAAKLEQRIDSLLLLSKDTLGFFAFVGDVFVDMNSIDTDNTTADINLKENTVTIGTDRSNAVDSSGGSLIDLSNLTELDVSFSPISRRSSTAYFTTNEDNSLSKIFHPENSSWVGKVVDSQSGSMICELKANISPSKDIYISRVAFNYKGSNSTGNSTVTLQYSVDGYNWNLVPSNTATKSLSGNMHWRFPKTAMRYVKFIFMKPAPDNDNNEYIFAADSVRFYGQTYKTDGNNIFISKSLSQLDKNKNPILFSKAALLTCQDTPIGTSIDYYISASKDNSNWTNWFAIAPVSSSVTSYPKVINITGVDWKDNEDETTTTLLDTSVASDGLSQKYIVRDFDSNFTGYRFKSTDFGVVNTAISISKDEDPNPIGNSVVVWRNVRDRTTYPDLNTVRNVARGWGLSGSKYSCFFEVIKSDGLVIDFGSSPCELDGKVVTGIVNISSGVHKFSTKSDFWYDISEDIDNLPNSIETEESLQALDPLYPYNHKYLIEGFPYADSFKGEKKYKGTDISAEFYCIKTSLFELENNINELGYFSIRGVGDEENPTLSVVLRYNSYNSDYANELCTVRWRSGESDATMYKYIKLKALLSTENTDISPALEAYRIKLGL